MAGHPSSQLLLLCLLLVCLVARAAASTSLNLTSLISSPVDCNNYQKVVETAALWQGYSFNIGEYGWPRDEAELKTTCQRNRDGLKVFQSYASECLSSEARDSALLFLQDRSELIENVCHPDETMRSGVINLSNCIYQNKLATLQAIERNAIAKAEAISRNQTGNSAHHGCCTLFVIANDFTRGMAPECSRTLMRQIIWSHFVTHWDRRCHKEHGAIWKVDDCKELIQDHKHSKPVSNSYVLPLLAVNQLLYRPL